MGLKRLSFVKFYLWFVSDLTIWFNKYENMTDMGSLEECVIWQINNFTQQGYVQLIKSGSTVNT